MGGDTGSFQGCWKYFPPWSEWACVRACACENIHGYFAVCKLSEREREREYLGSADPSLSPLRVM